MNRVKALATAGAAFAIVLIGAAALGVAVRVFELTAGI